MANGHVFVCVVIAVLLVLQGGLYARRSSWVIAVQPPTAAIAAQTRTAAPPPPVSSPTPVRLAASRELLAAANESGKECGEDTGEFPRNRILIIHEQHLQSMGCDVRLLRFVKDLVYLNQEVSMMFRGSTPAKMRQPKSKQLASILHIKDFEEDQLKKGLRDPPGLYEWTSTERFAQLMVATSVGTAAPRAKRGCVGARDPPRPGRSARAPRPWPWRTIASGQSLGVGAARACLSLGCLSLGWLCFGWRSPTRAAALRQLSPSSTTRGECPERTPAPAQARGYFNVVIIFLWFWYDPQPSVAELVLPVLRAHSPEERQPFVALLSDDAHALRSYRLGEVGAATSRVVVVRVV